MKFSDVWKQMKEGRVLYGATKAQMENAYKLRKEIYDIKQECQKRIDEVCEREQQSDLYIMNGRAYCSMLEVVYEQELK